MSAPRTEAAIRRLRELIQSGTYGPGAKLPPEEKLAEQLGIGRSTVREAVRTLSTMHVLDVRRGDATYVTSLRADVFIDGIAPALDLMADESALAVMEVRRVLEPAAAYLAATRIDAMSLRRLKDTVGRMAQLQHVAALVRADTELDAYVVAAAGNDVLAAILNGVTSRRWRTRIWYRLQSDNAIGPAIANRQHLFDALSEGDAELARAAALTRVCASALIMRQLMATPSPATLGLAEHHRATG